MQNSTTLSTQPDALDVRAHNWFFSGIGGTGMMPLAQILQGRGAQVSGSDRSYDQGRTPEKFAWLKAHGFALYPQDGSGISSADQIMVASAAVEDDVPEMVRAREVGCAQMRRADLLAALFNAAETGIAIGGTSGKSTVTAMLGWILADQGYDPTIMNGAVMNNFRSAEAPYASALAGSGEVFVSEVDESDGSIANYRPAIGILLNVSLDHMSMDKLRALFGGFLDHSAHGVINMDDLESRALLAGRSNVLTYGVDAQDVDLIVTPRSVDERRDRIRAEIYERASDTRLWLEIAMPGRHNLSNALAAIAGARLAGVTIEQAVESLGRFKGIARRFSLIGTSDSDISVIDDFGHNPEKCAATLRALRAHPGRVIAFFQPHGYGPLRQMGDELADIFAETLAEGDALILCDPVYYGGTVDRSRGSDVIIDQVKAAAEAGGKTLITRHIGARQDCGDAIVELAQPGDRIVIMGARDDSLTTFAEDIFARLS